MGRPIESSWIDAPHAESTQLSKFYVQTALRPIRSALVVDLTDQSAVQLAIELLSSHWGGMFSCIVPITTETPDKNNFENELRAVQNLLLCFEPDFVYIFEKSHSEYLDPYWPTFQIDCTKVSKIASLGLSILPSLNAMYRHILQVGNSRAEILSGALPTKSTVSLWPLVSLGTLPEFIRIEFERIYSISLDIKSSDASDDDIKSVLDGRVNSVLEVGSYGLNLRKAREAAYSHQSGQSFAFQSSQLFA